MTIEKKPPMHAHPSCDQATPLDSPAPSPERLDISIYGDPSLNRLVIMKLSTFELLQVIHVDGKAVYSADHITDDKAYVMVRGSNFIQVLTRDENDHFSLGRVIDLPFFPRTGAKNKDLGLELISGTNKPMFALVDVHTDRLVACGGRDEDTRTDIKNYDGTNATGHARWISKDQFLLADRENNEVSLYRVCLENGHWTTHKTDAKVLESSVHTFFGASSQHTHEHDASHVGLIQLYAATEGRDNDVSIPASVTELFVDNNSLSVGRSAEFAGGSHHPAVHDDYILAPAADCMVHVIDKQTMEVVKSIPAGEDAGHVVKITDRDMALVVNHDDTFMTAFKLSTLEKIKDFPVVFSNQPEYEQTLQSHTGRVSPDKKYYYNFATDAGTFFRVDLDTLTVDKTLYVGGTPKQAAQPGELF